MSGLIYFLISSVLISQPIGLKMLLRISPGDGNIQPNINNAISIKFVLVMFITPAAVVAEPTASVKASVACSI